MPTRDGRLSVKEILLRSALPALEAAADRRRRGRSASWEDCAAIFECLDGDDDGAITIEEFRGSWPTSSRSNLDYCNTYAWNGGKLGGMAWRRGTHCGGWLMVEVLLDLMNAGELALGDLL